MEGEREREREELIDVPGRSGWIFSPFPRDNKETKVKDRNPAD